MKSPKKDQSIVELIKKKTTNDQIYFATLVTTQNFTKMLRKLLLFYRLHIFESDQIKEERNKKKKFFAFF